MKALIIGDGVSGRGAYKLLRQKGIDCEYADEKLLGGECSDSEIDRLLCGLSFAVISPGVDFDNLGVRALSKRGLFIISELELGAMYLRGDIIAVTGTNGKTTTTTLIGFLLSGGERRVFLGGNIGIAVSSFAAETKRSDISVLECSSFQLEKVNSFHPHIAAILNITEDHLLRHKTMESYRKVKFGIAENMTECDYLLLNADDDFIMDYHFETRAKILYFSTRKKVFGCFIKRGCIYFNDNLTEKKLVSLSNIKLVGEHNLSNILCAVLAVYLETGRTDLLRKISDFRGVSHRIEFVRSINNISFFNDSKATNISSTLVAVKSFDCDIHLILGGSEKGYEFDNLFKSLPHNVKSVVVFGETKQKIMQASERCGYRSICTANTLEECVKICCRHAVPKDIILLSPACASFDMFSNFEERGNVFKKIVKELDENEDSLFENRTEK